MKPEEQKALAALRYILPLLEKHNLKWAIATSFACYVYGVERPITDIDIDVDTSKDDPSFKALIKDLKKVITEPLNHFTDPYYDNYNFEVTIDGQILDICSMKEMKMFDKKTNSYEPFYKSGFPAVEKVTFHDLELILLSKELIIKNKEMLTPLRESTIKDIDTLRAMISKKSA